MTFLLSSEGLQALRQEEGLRLKAYPDPASGGAPWTIGYGHTGPDVAPGLEITIEEAERLLHEDVREGLDALEQYVKVPLTQGQVDALVSLIFNIGVGAFRESTLLHKLNMSDYEGAAAEFPRWNRAAGRVNKGLTARRARERALFTGIVEGPTQDAKEKPVAIPSLLGGVLSAVLPKLLEALPWFSSGSHSAERNIKLAQTVGPSLVELAKQASGEAGVVEAVARLDEPAVRAEYTRLAAERWDDLRPLLEFEEASRTRAREWAQTITEGNDWRALSLGTLIGTLSLLVIAGGGWMFWHMIQPQSNLSPEQKGMVLGALIVAFGQVVQYWFGTSASSRSKDKALGDVAKGR